MLERLFQHKFYFLKWFVALSFVCFSNLAVAKDGTASSEVTKTASVEIAEDAPPGQVETPDKIQTVNTKSLLRSIVPSS